MKTLLKFSFILFVFLTTFNFSSICQIKVFDNNYVGINWSTTPLSRFVLNAAGSEAYQAWFYSPSRSSSGGGLVTISDMGTGSSNHIVSHLSSTYIGSNNFLYGIKSSASNSTPLTIGRTYGIYGLAGNAQSGYNYGVYGYLYGTNYGAAIFGTINGLGDIGLTAQFAGYFRGDVMCENIIYATSFQTLSDEKYKTNITDIDSIDALSNFSKLSPKKYNLKQFEVNQSAGDTISIKKFYNESDQLFTKAKYGVIAQELKEIYPDLVYQDNKGNLTVDYTGLIPIMIKAIQAQQKKIENLEVKISQLVGNK